MDELLSGWMCGWMDEYVKGVCVCVSGWICEWVDGWIRWCLSGWMCQ